MNKILKTKVSREKIAVLELPKSDEDMENYVLNNKTKIYDFIVSNIETAINKRWPNVEIFKFQETNFVVILNQRDFKENLQNAFDFSLENEHFEICAKAKKAIDKLDKINFVTNYKINPRKRDVKKETPTKKANKRRNNTTRKKRNG